MEPKYKVKQLVEYKQTRELVSIKSIISLSDKDYPYYFYKCVFIEKPDLSIVIQEDSLVDPCESTEDDEQSLYEGF